MKYGIIKVKRAFLYEENGVDVVDEVFFGWSVMWEDEGEWIEVWTHYGYRGWMERNLIEEKSREWMEEREKAGNTYVVTRGFADVMRGARVQSRMLETLGRGCFVEKMEETENGYCRVKLANGISGLWSVRRGILDASTGGAGRRRMGLTVRVWCLWCI